MKWQDDIQYLKGVGPKKAALLAKLGIQTMFDLLTWYPRGYEDQSALTPIASLHAGETATVSGSIMNLTEKQGRSRKMSILTALVGDGTGFLQIIWFNQKYLKRQLKIGCRLFVTGKATYAYGGQGQLAMSNLSSFQILQDGEAPEAALGIQPIYSATEKLNQKFFRKLMHTLLENPPEWQEVLPESVRMEYALMDRRQAFGAIHFPKDFEELQAARRRLAFDELYLIQCGLLLIKKQGRESRRGIRHLSDSRLTREVMESLPFRLTGDQAKCLCAVKSDMEKTVPMRRLVQGDVGSGKTVIAMLALVKTVENGWQGALMAPTEILAAQHYESFRKQLAPFGIRVGFLSGRLTKKKRQELYDAMEAQELDIVIGTHALIQEGVHFAKLGLVVTDEQHRFGIAQRAELEKKSSRLPDVLVMTATPIPRTMTLTIYGDLDVSLIRELPPGRQPVRTFVRRPERRPLIYDFVHKEIEAGRQAYVICPLIEMNEELPIPSAEEVYEELRHGIFRDMRCGLVHGRMKAAEKEQVMQDFYENRVQLLVSTTVIEVGVNVPNASIMVVEHAERFGLAQLHQLRGRIGRGSYRSYCVLVSESKSQTAKERLQIMESTADGFQLAEEDLKLRGPGQFFGSMQHGLPDLKIADVLHDMDILLDARRAAMQTIERREDMRFVRPILSMQYGEHFKQIRDV
ncbi:MAG: ATP-dependent DNA helicase RecG [Selenomonadaceae bacterium]|nr:ATP-dependent DNA helicase RecG [Selenomonadaceae bacterium]